MGGSEIFALNARANRRQQQLEALLPVAMLEVSLSGQLLWANARWETLLKLHPSEPLIEHWFDVVHPDERTRVMTSWKACTESLTPLTLDFRLLTSNGDCRHVDLEGRVFSDAETSDTTYLLAIVDVTDNRRNAELVRTTRELETWAEQSAATLAEQSRDLGIVTAVVACCADAIVIVDTDGNGRYANDAFLQLFDLPQDFHWDDLLQTLGGDAAVEQALRRAKSENGSSQAVVSLNRPQRGPLLADICGFALTDATLRNVGFALIIRDLSTHQALEEERARLAAEVFAAQEEAIRELSTPLLPIGPGILAMPLIGNIDEARGQRILDTLLAGIQQHQASVAILDVTGVRQINDDVAGILLRSAQAARLLGTKVLLTGIGPLVARAIINLGVDLGPVQTHATLEQGILNAFARTRYRQQSHRSTNYFSTSSSR